MINALRLHAQANIKPCRQRLDQGAIACRDTIIHFRVFISIKVDERETIRLRAIDISRHSLDQRRPARLRIKQTRHGIIDSLLRLFMHAREEAAHLRAIGALVLARETFVVRAFLPRWRFAIDVKPALERQGHKQIAVG